MLRRLIDNRGLWIGYMFTNNVGMVQVVPASLAPLFAPKSEPAPVQKPEPTRLEDLQMATDLNLCPDCEVWTSPSWSERFEAPVRVCTRCQLELRPYERQKVMTTHRW